MSFDLEIKGEGPPVLFLPGSYSTPRAWSGVMERLAGWQMISVSLPGYGRTQERRDPTDCRMADLIGFVADVAEKIGTPFHLVGHSFGGQVALAATLEGGLPIQSLVTFEANPIYMRRAGTAFAWQAALQEMVARFDSAVAKGDPAAAGIIIDYYCGAGVFDTMPEPIRAFCAATAHTNVLDWHTARDFAPWATEFGAVSLPTTLCRGDRANIAIREITDELGGIIPKAKTAVVDGADHFLVSTHPQDCARIIADHLQRVSGGPTG